ncbi:hypothetical protein V5799_021129, partial [Amblyomma americanum]
MALTMATASCKDGRGPSSKGVRVSTTKGSSSAPTAAGEEMKLARWVPSSRERLQEAEEKVFS